MPCLYKKHLYYFVVYSGCCPRAPSRKQCSLLVGEAIWHSLKSNITASGQHIILYYVFWYHTGKAQKVLIFVTAICGDWWVTRKMPFAHNSLLICQIVLKVCGEYGNITAVLCANFQNDYTTQMDALGKRYTHRIHYINGSGWQMKSNRFYHTLVYNPRIQLSHDIIRALPFCIYDICQNSAGTNKI